jgi:hypothetical protein
MAKPPVLVQLQAHRIQSQKLSMLRRSKNRVLLLGVVDLQSYGEQRRLGMRKSQLCICNIGDGERHSLDIRALK